MSDLFTKAQGRWREILPALGISTQFLSGKHGPCPMCGGKDRFRWDDKRGEGTYICGQCGAGNGWTLVRKFNGWDSATTSREIEGIVGHHETAAPIPPAVPYDNSASAARLLAECNAPSVVAAYLKRRGLMATSPVLQGHLRCPYFVDDALKRRRVLGHFPTVVAPIVNIEGKLIGVQRVYDADLKEDRKKVLGDMKGGAVRLDDPTDELGVCEGFETGLACRQLFGIPMWAALSENNLQIFEPPSGILQLHVFADADVNSVGQAAAYSLAVRVNRWNDQHKTGAAPVRVYVPQTLGEDWLDVLNGGGP